MGGEKAFASAPHGGIPLLSTLFYLFHELEAVTVPKLSGPKRGYLRDPGG